MIARVVHPSSLGLLSLLLVTSCSPRIDSDWQTIDDLDARLGRITAIDEQGVLQPQPTPPRTSSDQDGVRRIEGLMSLMSAGEPQDLSLAEVRRSTLENNLRIQSSMVTPEVSAQRLRAEQAKFQWTLGASVEQSRVLAPESGAGQQLINIQTDSLNVQPGLEIPLRTGGTVSVDWSLQSTDSSSNNLEDLTSTSQPSVTLQQPLLRGGGFDYNEASIVIAGANLGVSRAQAQGVVINQLVRAETAYWRLHLAWQVLEIDLDLYRTSRQLLEEQRTLVGAGAGSIANVYNFETLLASSVDRVIQSERGVLAAVREIKVVMQKPGLTLDGSVALTPVSKPRLVGFDFDARRLVMLAFENRTDLLELEFQQLARSVEVMLRENEVLPSLDLRSSWTGNGFDRGSSLSTASRDLFDGGRPPGWSVGLNASIPLGNDVALANYQAALLQRLQTVADRRQQEILVTQQVLDAIDALETGWNSIVTTELQLRAAQRFYDAYQTLFNRGQIPSSNLTQALQTLNEAKVQKASAEVDYQIDLAQLALASGCLLGHAGVDWEGTLDQDRLNSPARPPLEGIPAGERNQIKGNRPTLEQMIEAMPPEDHSGRGDHSVPSSSDPEPAHPASPSESGTG